MSIKQFRVAVMVIVLIALLELVVGVFYYFVLFVPNKEKEEVAQREENELKLKTAEQERLLEEAKLKHAERMEEIKLEVKEIDLELLRISRWEDKGEEFEALRREEEEKLGKRASLISCMKIVVENYHAQWNKICEEKGLPSACSLADEDAGKINGEYEVGKKQCDDFFATVDN